MLAGDKDARMVFLFSYWECEMLSRRLFMLIRT